MKRWVPFGIVVVACAASIMIFLSWSRAALQAIAIEGGIVCREANSCHFFGTTITMRLLQIVAAIGTAWMVFALFKTYPWPARRAPDVGSAESSVAGLDN